MKSRFLFFFGFILLVGFSIFAGPSRPNSTLAPVLKTYFAFQKALSGDQLQQVKSLASAMKIALEGSLNGPHSSEEEMLFKELLKQATELNNDTDTKKCRIQFGNLSKPLVEYLKSHPTETKQVQLFFCPMFPQGYAFWVQPQGESLANPYWGKEMLTCGVKRPW